MNEAGFWSDRIGPMLKAQCNAARLRFRADRIENLVGVGNPDVNYTIAGVDGHIELKYSARHPVRATTPVLGHGNGLRRSQVIWAYRHIRAGGRVHCLIGTPVATWLIDLRPLAPADMVALDLASAARLGEIAVWGSFQGSRGTLPLALLAEGPGARKN